MLFIRDEDARLQKPDNCSLDMLEDVRIHNATAPRITAETPNQSRNNEAKYASNHKVRPIRCDVPALQA